MILASYERVDGVEAVVFLDADSGDCVVVQRASTVGGRGASGPAEAELTTGLGPPIPGGVASWRAVDGLVELTLSTRGRRLFAGQPVASFAVEPENLTYPALIAHLTRLLGPPAC